MLPALWIDSEPSNFGRGEPQKREASTKDPSSCFSCSTQHLFSPRFSIIWVAPIECSDKKRWLWRSTVTRWPCSARFKSNPAWLTPSWAEPESTGPAVCIQKLERSSAMPWQSWRSYEGSSGVRASGRSTWLRSTSTSNCISMYSWTWRKPNRARGGLPKPSRPPKRAGRARSWSWSTSWVPRSSRRRCRRSSWIDKAT